jgi:hypothetical protein
MQISTWRTARTVRVSSLPVAATPPPPTAEEAEAEAEEGGGDFITATDAAGARGTPLLPLPLLPLLLPRASAALAGRRIVSHPPPPAIPTGGGDGSA